MGYEIHDGYYDYFTKLYDIYKRYPPPDYRRRGKKMIYPTRETWEENRIVVRKNRTRYTQPHGRTIFWPFANFFLSWKQSVSASRTCDGWAGLLSFRQL